MHPSRRIRRTASSYAAARMLHHYGATQDSCKPGKKPRWPRPHQRDVMRFGIAAGLPGHRPFPINFAPDARARLAGPAPVALHASEASPRPGCTRRYLRTMIRWETMPRRSRHKQRMVPGKDLLSIRECLGRSAFYPITPFQSPGRAPATRHKQPRILRLSRWK